MYQIKKKSQKKENNNNKNKINKQKFVQFNFSIFFNFFNQ